MSFRISWSKFKTLRYKILFFYYFLLICLLAAFRSNLTFTNSYVTVNNKYANFIRFPFVEKDTFSTVDDSTTKTTIRVINCDQIETRLENKTANLDFFVRLLNDNDRMELLEIMLIERHPDLADNGYWTPKHCRPVQNVAVIVPYRNRHHHLLALLNVLLPLFKKQAIAFQFFVVEQTGNDTFNKGRLMNSGFEFVNKFHPDFDCFIFHDVDLVPENEQNLYACNDLMPKHMSPAVNTLNYELPYAGLVGGVLAIKKEHFWNANGYSNSYWGWGGEDDDLFTRLQAQSLIVDRPSNNIGRYTMLGHVPRPHETFKITEGITVKFAIITEIIPRSALFFLIFETFAQNSTVTSLRWILRQDSNAELERQKRSIQLLEKAYARYEHDGVRQLGETGALVLQSESKKFYTHIFVNIGQYQPPISEQFVPHENKLPQSTNITLRPNIWSLYNRNDTM